MEKQTRAARAILYARFVAERAKLLVNDEQYEQGIKYIEAKGYELVSVYTDESATGTHTDHPAMNNLRADAAAGKFDVVVVFDLSRIARNALAVRAFLDDMQRCGVTVESVKEPRGGNALWQLKRIK